MAQSKTIRKTLHITADQSEFLKQKKIELRKLVGPDDVINVSESTVLQGLLDFWMAFESRKLREKSRISK